jgi:hypothetical protein
MGTLDKKILTDAREGLKPTKQNVKNANPAGTNETLVAARGALTPPASRPVSPGPTTPGGRRRTRRRRARRT